MFSTPAKILSNKYFEPTVFQIYVSVNFIWKKYLELLKVVNLQQFEFIKAFLWIFSWL